MADTEPRLAVERSASGLLLRGEIDAHTAPRLAGALHELASENASAVTLDMSGVDFIDSSGLRVIVEALNAAHSVGGSLVIANPSRPVARLLELSGLQDLLVASD